MMGARAFQASVVLRLFAFAIAAAGVIDPSVTAIGSTRARLAVIEQDPTSRVSAQIRAALLRDLGAAYEIVPHIISDADAAIVIGDRYPDSYVVSGFLTDDALARSVSRTAPFTRTVSTVTIAAPKVRIARASAPRDVPPATTIHLEVDVDAAGVAGQTAELTARIAGLTVGRASHRWTEPRERWRAALDVVPVGDAPFLVHLEAATAAADVVVPLRAQPLRVEVYDPRPSWASTFVRRALEADRRFAVESVSVSSRGIAARTRGAVPLNDPRVDAFDAIVVGGLDRLAAADARSLERYMRERGGAVVLLPDRRIDAGPARDLISGRVRALDRRSLGEVGQPDLTERLLEKPAALSSRHSPATLRASELLIWRSLPPGGDVVAQTPAEERAPVIVSLPRGAGRLVVSGAMDAWRFRAADDAAFDRFWQATLAGFALATLPPLDITVSPSVVRPGEPAEIVVRARDRSASARVAASIDGGQPIRLWPDAEGGVYRGRLLARATPGRSAIDAHTTGPTAASASRVVPVRVDASHETGAIPSLSMLATSHGGIDVGADRLGDLVSFIRGHVELPRAPLRRHPMRSAWWIVPFAACLSAEWWLRRRSGLR